MSEYAKYSGLAFQMVSVILVGAFGGRLLDKKFCFEKPWLTMVFTVLAVFLAVYIAIKDFIGKK